jgi:hypothetical protein
MLAVIGTADRFFGTNLSRIVSEAGIRSIRSSKVDRIIKELKQPGCLAIIDMNWEDVQAAGVLKQLVNIGRITDNKVICICPNQEEDLKKLARNSRAAEVFIRFDLETLFKEYLKNL